MLLRRVLMNPRRPDAGATSDAAIEDRAAERLAAMLEARRDTLGKMTDEEYAALRAEARRQASDDTRGEARNWAWEWNPDTSQFARRRGSVLIGTAVFALGIVLLALM